MLWESAITQRRIGDRIRFRRYVREDNSAPTGEPMEVEDAPRAEGDPISTLDEPDTGVSAVPDDAPSTGAEKGASIAQAAFLAVTTSMNMEYKDLREPALTRHDHMYQTTDITRQRASNTGYFWAVIHPDLMIRHGRLYGSRNVVREGDDRPIVIFYEMLNHFAANKSYNSNRMLLEVASMIDGREPKQIAEESYRASGVGFTGGSWFEAVSDSREVSRRAVAALAQECLDIISLDWARRTARKPHACQERLEVHCL
jgi:hypothetical protein